MVRLAVQNPSHHARAHGFITVRGEEVKNCNAKLSITIGGEKLENKVR
jgi:hypothetical protein